MVNKKLIIFISAVFSLPLFFYLFAQNNEDSHKEKRIVAENLLREISKERDSLKRKEENLKKVQQNLESFESDLNKRYDEYLQKKNDLDKREKEFNEKFDNAMFDRQVIESYENIDPEQAALLMQEMYKKDKKLPPLIIRKISGKKAGRIIEALIELDTPTSAELAKDVLEFFKPSGD